MSHSYEDLIKSGPIYILNYPSLVNSFSKYSKHEKYNESTYIITTKRVKLIDLPVLGSVDRLFYGYFSNNFKA